MASFIPGDPVSFDIWSRLCWTHPQANEWVVWEAKAANDQSYFLLDFLKVHDTGEQSNCPHSNTYFTHFSLMFLHSDQ